MIRNNQAPLLFNFFTEIGIIEQLARTRFESVMPDEIKLSQFTVLNHLVRLDGKWSPVRLAKALQVTKAAITNNLQRLESRGLVIIEADPDDGRAKLVSLTAAGREVREQCISNIEPFLVDMERKLNQQEFLNALPFLQELRKYMDSHRN